MTPNAKLTHDQDARSDDPQPPAVVVEGVTVDFDAVRALSEVSLEIPSGEIRSLLGRNGAGKSTLVNVLAGLIEPSAGSVSYAGRPAPPLTHSSERRKLVGTVFQHSTLTAELSVAENLFLGDLPHSALGVVSWSTVHRKARALLDEWELPLSERRPVADLSLGEKQLVEIVRELSRGARFVVLDEPTSRLTAREIDLLHRHVKNAQRSGVTFLYISHHLSEVMAVCDSATVLRDGRVIATHRIAETTSAALIKEIVGSADIATGGAAPRPAVPKSERPRLVLDRIAAPGLDLTDRTVGVEPGEMIGFAGIVGSGKEQLAAILAGDLPAAAGHVELDGERLPLGDVATLIGRGVSTVPADRHRDGLVLGMGIGENVTMSVGKRLAGALGITRPGKRDTSSAAMMAEVGVVASSPRQPAAELSGGNQQKGVLARALASDPSVLVLVNPTTGVDIASKQTIFEVIEHARDQGTSVVLLSDELEEYETCDRVLVLFDGRVVEELTPPWNQSQLLSAMEGVGRQ